MEWGLLSGWFGFDPTLFDKLGCILMPIIVQLSKPMSSRAASISERSMTVTIHRARSKIESL
jgi:hypothetical protein